jgi:hypothetical protein
MHIEMRTLGTRTYTEGTPHTTSAATPIHSSEASFDAAYKACKSVVFGRQEAYAKLVRSLEAPDSFKPHSATTASKTLKHYAKAIGRSGIHNPSLITYAMAAMFRGDGSVVSFKALALLGDALSRCPEPIASTGPTQYRSVLDALHVRLKKTDRESAVHSIFTGLQNCVLQAQIRDNPASVLSKHLLRAAYAAYASGGYEKTRKYALFATQNPGYTDAVRAYAYNMLGLIHVQQAHQSRTKDSFVSHKKAAIDYLGKAAQHHREYQPNLDTAKGLTGKEELLLVGFRAYRVFSASKPQPFFLHCPTGLSAS